MCQHCKPNTGESASESVPWMHILQGPFGTPIVCRRPTLPRVCELQRREWEKRMHEDKRGVSILRRIFRRRRPDVGS